MKLYEVRYKNSDWTADIKTVQVVASSVSRASEFISKDKFIRSSGYVLSVMETVPTVVVAK